MVKNSTCQGKAHQFNPSSGKTPHATEQLSLRTTTGLCSTRGATALRSFLTATKNSPSFLQLEKAYTKQGRSSAAKNKQTFFFLSKPETKDLTGQKKKKRLHASTAGSLRRELRPSVAKSTLKCNPKLDTAGPSQSFRDVCRAVKMSRPLCRVPAGREAGSARPPSCCSSHAVHKGPDGMYFVFTVFNFFVPLPLVISGLTDPQARC